MPVWHERTRRLVEEGRIRVAGIIEEQHPDRCRLFMQWHRMDWPILVDAPNLLGVARVPITLFIDEHGIIRKVDARPEDLPAFLEATHPSPGASAEPPDPPDLDAVIEGPEPGGDAGADAWMALGDALLLRGREEDLDRCVEAYRRAVEKDGPPSSRFRLGVALRRRWESEHRRPTDFQECLRAWREALDRRPNQYIWRRRIQQYGPRPDRPYPFYTWIAEAREAILDRGETPVSLRVEPTAAEVAGASEADARIDADPGAAPDPDPEGRIDRDAAPLIDLEVAVAPATDRKNRAARIHLVFRPSEENRGHWNNEQEGMGVWLHPPDGVELERSFVPVAPGTRSAISGETRRVEIDVRIGREATGKETVAIPGYALYYACEDVDGKCLFLRKDFRVEVPVEPVR